MSNIFGILEIFIKSSRVLFGGDSKTKELKIPVLTVFCSGIKLELLLVSLRTSYFKWGFSMFVESLV